MSAGDAILKLLLIGEDRSASEALKKVGDTANKTADHVSALTRAGDVMKGIMGASIVTGAIDGIKNLGMMGLTTAASMEQAQIGFTTMLGSGEKAQGFLNQLKQFAAATPFEFPELQTAASSLISIGIDSSKVIPIMTTLGNVTSGMGTGSEGIRRATVAIQQMNAAGKIQAQDLNQLRDAGIPVYDLLAAAMGKSKEEVAALANSGKLGKDALDKMMNALETGKGLERFSGLMDAQSQSLSGLVSTFKDTLGQGLATAIEPAIPMLKDGLGFVSNWLANDVLPKLSSTLTWVMNAGKGVVQWAQNTGVYSSLQGVFVVLGEAGRKLGSVFSDIGKWVGDHKQLFADIANNALLFAQNAIAAVIDAVGNVRDDLEKVVGWVKQNQEWLAPLAVSVGVFVAGLKAYQLVMAAVKVATAAWAAVQAALNVVMDANPIGIIILAIAALVAGIIYAYQHSEKFREIVDTTFKAIGAAGEWLWNNALQPVVKAIVQGFVWVNEGIIAVLRALGNIPGFGWAKDAADLMQRATDKAKEMADGIKKIPDKTVDVQMNVTANYSQGAQTALALSRGTTKLNLPGFASGGNPPVGQPFWVGENGPEIMYTDSPATIIPAGQAASMAAGGRPLGGGGGMVVNLAVTVQGDSDPLGAAKKIETKLMELSRSRGGGALNFKTI